MSDVAKVVTIIGNSPDGFAEAAPVAVQEAAKTLRGISGADVVSMSCEVEGDRVRSTGRPSISPSASSASRTPASRITSSAGGTRAGVRALRERDAGRAGRRGEENDERQRERPAVPEPVSPPTFGEADVVDRPDEGREDDHGEAAGERSTDPERDDADHDEDDRHGAVTIRRRRVDG